MGIRINKVIGYGLTDVVSEGMQITDPRINPDSHLLTGIAPDREVPDYWTYVEQFVREEGDEAWIEVQMRKMLTDHEADTRWLCTYQAERGLPNVLVVRPVGFPAWSRHDDPIDFQSEVLRPDHPDARVEPTTGGLYPHDGLHMDVRTGERIRDATVNTWRQVVNGNADDEDKLDILNMLAQTLGYKDHEEAERFVAPFVPHGVRWVCGWGGVVHFSRSVSPAPPDDLYLLGLTWSYPQEGPRANGGLPCSPARSPTESISARRQPLKPTEAEAG